MKLKFKVQPYQTNAVESEVKRGLLLTHLAFV